MSDSNNTIEHTYQVGSKERSISVPEKRFSASGLEQIKVALQSPIDRNQVVDTREGKFNLTDHTGLYHCPSHSIYTIWGETETYESIEVVEWFLLGNEGDIPSAKQKITPFGLETLLFECDTEYRLIKPIDNDTTEIYPTSPHVISVEEAISNFESEHRGYTTLTNITKSDGEPADCTVQTEKGPLQISSFPGILQTESGPYYYETNPIYKDGNLHIRSVPSAPAAGFTDTPDEFVFRLHSGEYVLSRYNEERNRYLKAKLEDVITEER